MHRHQRRGVVHFHAIIRLDGIDPADPDAVIPPPAGLDVTDLTAAITTAVPGVRFTTDTHPTRRKGWVIGWGSPKGFDIRPITGSVNGHVTGTPSPRSDVCR